MNAPRPHPFSILQARRPGRSVWWYPRRRWPLDAEAIDALRDTARTVSRELGAPVWPPRRVCQPEGNRHECLVRHRRVPGLRRGDRRKSTRRRAFGRRDRAAIRAPSRRGSPRPVTNCCRWRSTCWTRRRRPRRSMRPCSSFGRIDVVVNNAGRGLLSAVEEASDAAGSGGVRHQCLRHSQRAARGASDAARAAVGPHRQSVFDRWVHRLGRLGHLLRDQIRRRGFLGSACARGRPARHRRHHRGAGLLPHRLPRRLKPEHRRRGHRRLRRNRGRHQATRHRRQPRSSPAIRSRRPRRSSK